MLTRNSAKGCRVVCADTETTGFGAQRGDRVVEIGLVELIDRVPTGRVFHKYINPQRSVPESAIAVHGLTQEFLSDKPLFVDVVDEFLEFIDGSEVVIHNAPFDMGFLNMELAMVGRMPLDSHVSCVIDTLVMARSEGGAKRNSLDALCDRYGISNKHRVLHGALLDAELLSDVYLCMTRGQDALAMEYAGPIVSSRSGISSSFTSKRVRVIRATSDEAIAHEQYVEKMKKENGGASFY